MILFPSLTLHGSVALIALVLLFIYVFFYHSTSSLTSLILFIFAVGGGVTLMYLDITGKAIPKWLAVGHGIIAITAFIFLLIFAFQ